MQKLTAVKSTKDYSIFRTMNGNRSVKRSHARNIAKGMVDKPDLLRIQPIIVNDQMYVIDGQHRLEACKMNNSMVYYKVVPNLNLMDIHTLNENNSGWNINDFVDSYANMGIEDYKKLRDFSKKYNLPATLSANILMGAAIHGGGTGRKAIRDGTFKVKNWENGNKLATILFNLSQYIKPSIVRSGDFIRALNTAMEKEMRVPILIKKLKKHNIKFEKQGSYKQYLVALEEVYNYYTFGKNRINIV